MWLTKSDLIDDFVFYRSLAPDYVQENVYNGLKVLEYSAVLIKPEEKCYCLNPKKCLKPGALDLTNCSGPRAFSQKNEEKLIELKAHRYYIGLKYYHSHVMSSARAWFRSTIGGRFRGKVVHAGSIPLIPDADGIITYIINYTKFEACIIYIIYLSFVLIFQYLRMENYYP